MEINELIKNRKEFVDAQIKNGFDLSTVLVGLYSDASHFVYEILQNAEDAKANQITFDLYPDKLIITHNGIPFTSEDIEAITGISNIQNDKKNDLEKIGKFGIGFKSVYAVTNSPRIQSGKYDFEIINFVLPDKFSDTKEFSETTITLTFNHQKLSSEEIFELIKSKFKNFEFYNLLFLNNLNTINLKSGSQIRIITKNGKETSLKGSRIAYKSIITSNDEDFQYLLFKEDIKHEAFANLKNKPKVAIAFKQSLVNGRLQIIEGDSSKLFAFFETDYETFLKFIVQAPFVTTPARDNINFKESVNLALLNEVIDLTKKALEYISANKLISVNFLNQLPINLSVDKKEFVYWKFFETIKEEFLSGRKYLPANDGSLLASATAVGLIRGKELKQILASKKDLQMLFGIDYWLDPKITSDKTPELRSYIMKALNIKEYGSDDFARAVTKEFFESKQDTWVKSFYGFLNGNQQSLYVAGKGKSEGILRKKPIIRLANGKHTEPFDEHGKPKVFLPVLKKKVPYDTINPVVISNKPSFKFINDKLGIKEPNFIDEIRQYIVPLYRTGSNSYPSDKIHLEHVKFIIEVYLNGKEAIKSELVELIKAEGINFFRVRELNSPKQYYGGGDICYFQEKKLKDFFRFTEKVYFLNDEFYSSVSLELFHEIALRCGVKRYVRRLSFDPLINDEKKELLRLNSPYKSKDFTWYQPSSIVDNTLYGLSGMLTQDELSKEDSVLIWQIILEFIQCDINKEDLFRGIYRWIYYGNRFTYFPSQLLIRLRNEKWLYSEQDICCRPGEITISSLSHDYDIVSEEARFLIDKLKFKTEAEDEYLSQMPEEKRNELLEAAELIRISKETGIDYKTLLQQKIGEEKRAEYEAELYNAPDLEDVNPVEIDFKGFDNSIIDVATQDTSDNNDNDDEPDTDGKESPKNGQSNLDNQLPQDIKNKIGHRGELIVFHKFLKKNWKKKHKLIRETESEMEFENVEGENYTIIHLNEAGKKGIGCDILIKQGEEIIKYIEVKSTKTKGKEFYSVSGYQWALAHKNYNLSIGNNYSIYVVTDVLGDNPPIIPIDNPIKKWKDGKLRANPVNIELG